MTFLELLATFLQAAGAVGILAGLLLLVVTSPKGPRS